MFLKMHLDVVKKNAGTMTKDLREFISAQKHKLINVETSTRCTLRCPQCTRAKLYAPKHTSDYKETVSRIANGNDLTLKEAEMMLNFTDSGLMLCGQLSDPVFWPNFLEFLKLSNNYPDKKIQIHTAATKNSLGWYKKAYSLCHENVTWIFGIDGLSHTSPIYRIGQDGDLIMKAMLLGKEMGINVEWQFIVFEHNVGQLNIAAEIAKDKGIPFQYIKSNRVGGNVEVPVEFRPSRNKETVYNF